MKPTQEQLNDPNWWDEHTPEGTTHVSISPTAAFPWLKDDGVNIFWSSGRNEWVKYTDREVREEHFSGAIPRPTEWRGPEDGLPPVGAECRIGYQGSQSVHTERVKITYHGNGVSCYINSANGEEYSISHYGHEFRPLQTGRDEALAEMWKIMNDNADYGLGGMAGALYDAGWRKRISRGKARAMLRDTSAVNSALEETRSSTPPDSRSDA